MEATKMFGMIIKQAPADWEILQQENGSAVVHLSGSYSVPQAALNVGVGYAVPVVRLVRETDNFQIIPWTPAEYTLEDKERYAGSWHIALTVPAGGLYRIETGLDSASSNGAYIWMFRGDVRFHIGVGNLFVIAGQSNAAGFGQDWMCDEPQLGVHVFRNNNTWSLAAHPLNESTGADEDNFNTEVRVSGTSPFLSFGRIFKQLSGCPVGLIPAAKGGSPVELWNREGDGSLYRNMLRKLRLCGGRPAGILWYQGCADTSGSSPAIYEEKYRRLIENVREDLGYPIPFFTCQINRVLSGGGGSGWGRIREIQRKVAGDTPGVYILPMLTCSLTDEVHNNSSSNILSGERLAKLCGHVLYGTPEFLAPDISAARITEDQKLELSFRNACYGFIINRSTAAECGFSAEDAEGPVELGHAYAVSNVCLPGQILIDLTRNPKPGMTVSFCCETCPSFTPPVAAVTYLPPLAFYRFPVDM